MTAITNGTQTITPALVEFHPIGQVAPADAPIRLEAQLLFGPMRDRLRPRKGILWWGRFSVDDHVGLTVYASRRARLRIQILDLEFRVVAEATRTAGNLRAHAPVRQSGPVFFRVVSEGDEE